MKYFPCMCAVEYQKTTCETHILLVDVSIAPYYRNFVGDEPTLY